MKKIICIIGIAAIATACSNDNDWDATGTFEATEVVVSAKGTGQIMSFNIEEGQEVEADKQLGYLDMTQLELQKAQFDANNDNLSATKSQLDASKDQSYFLYRLNQSQLARALFPLGAMLKRDVRRLAGEIGLPVAAKKDSTGICFIGERPFREFLARYLPAKPGEIRALEDNRLLGEHQGLMYHTIGQRKGLHIGGRRDGRGASCGAHEAWYVAAKSVADNILYVVQGHDHPALLQHTLHLADPNWIAGNAPDPAAHYTAKPRYRSPDTACTFTPAEPAALHFTQPVWAAAPGQSAVLYQGEVCLGGGIII